MVGQDLLNVETKLSEKDLVKVCAGASLSGSFVSSFTSAFKTVYEFGQHFGGSMRRIITKNTCKF